MSLKESENIPYVKAKNLTSTSRRFIYPEDVRGLNFGLILLLLFAFFRPITISFHHIGSLSLLDIFGIASSYAMLIGLCFYLMRLKVEIIFIIISFYIFYCMLSLLWGSNYRDVARMILPFIPFFLVFVAVRTEAHTRYILLALIAGYIVPILGSVFLILAGKSDIIITGSQFARQSGLSSGVHTLGHGMLFFSFVFCLYQSLVQHEKKGTWRLFMMILLVGSFFCIYKSYTRTVMLGALIFWSIYLWSVNKKWFLILIFTGIVLGAVYYSNMQNLVLQDNHAHKKVDRLNVASSGRIELWRHNINVFGELPLHMKLLGVGIGNEWKKVQKTQTVVVGSHNDFLQVLMMQGIIGLFLYLWLYGILMLKILFSEVNKHIKIIFVGFLVAVLVMNFVSNSYIARFQMAQLFWLFMGLFFVFNNKLFTIGRMLQQES